MKIVVVIGDDYVSISKLKREKYSSYVEKYHPEDGLYPTLIRVAIREFIDSGEGNLFIKTHNPYVLGELNNLLYAYNISQFNKEAINDIIPERYWLNPDNVEAYKVMKGEDIRDIFDRESGLIDNGELDEFSTILNEEYAEMSYYYE